MLQKPEHEEMLEGVCWDGEGVNKPPPRLGLTPGAAKALSRRRTPCQDLLGGSGGFPSGEGGSRGTQGCSPPPGDTEPLRLAGETEAGFSPQLPIKAPRPPAGKQPVIPAATQHSWGL